MPFFSPTREVSSDVDASGSINSVLEIWKATGQILTPEKVWEGKCGFCQGNLEFL